MPPVAGAEAPPSGSATAPSHAPDLDQEAAAVRAVWEGLGLPGLVDLHVHFLPQNVLDKVWAYFDTAEQTLGQPWPVVYRTDEADRLARLRAYGVRAFPTLLYPHKAGMAAWLNGWAAQFAAEQRAAGHADVLPTGTFYPEPEAAEYVREALDLGARTWKAHVQVGGYDPRDPLLDHVWGQLSDAQVPVVVHCGSGPRRGAHTGPGPFREVLRRHPRLVAVIAHLGLPEAAEFLALTRQFPRVHLDTTMAFTDFMERLLPFPRELLPELADLGDRVVLGTDFPNVPYPYLHQLEALARLELGDDWLRAVLHDNGARLLAEGPA